MEQEISTRYRVSPLSEKLDFKSNMDSSITVPPPPVTRFSEPVKLEVMKRRARRASSEMTVMRRIVHKGFSCAEYTKPRITSVPIKLNSTDLSRLRFSMFPRSGQKPDTRIAHRVPQTRSLPQSLISGDSSAVSAASRKPLSMHSAPSVANRPRVTSMPIILVDEEPDPAPASIPVRRTYTPQVPEHAAAVPCMVPSTPDTSTTYYTSFSVSSSPFSTPKNTPASSSDSLVPQEPLTPSSKSLASDTSLTSSLEQSYHTAKSHLSSDTSSIPGSPESIISAFIDCYSSDYQSSENSPKTLDSANSAEYSIFSHTTQNSLSSNGSASLLSWGTGSVIIPPARSASQRYVSLPEHYMHKPLPRPPYQDFQIPGSPLIKETNAVEDLNADYTSIFIDPNEGLSTEDSSRSAQHTNVQPAKPIHPTQTQKGALSRKSSRKSYGSVETHEPLSEREKKSRIKSMQHLKRSRINPFMLQGYQDYVSPRVISSLN